MQITARNMKKIASIIFYSFVYVTCASLAQAQQVQKPLPKFTPDTIREANTLVLYDSTPLNTCKAFLFCFYKICLSLFIFISP